MRRYCKAVIAVIIGIIVILNIVCALTGDMYSSASYTASDSLTGMNGKLCGIDIDFTGNDINGDIYLSIDCDHETVFSTHIPSDSVKDNRISLRANVLIDSSRSYKVSVLPLTGCKYTFLFYSPLDTVSVINAVSGWLIMAVFLISLLFFSSKYSGLYVKIKSMIPDKIFPAVICIAELTGILIILSFADLNLKTSSTVFLLLVSMAAPFLSNLSAKCPNHVILYLLRLYLAFALVGQRTLLTSQRGVFDSTISAAGALIFITAFLWSIPVINAVIYMLDKMSKIIIKGRRISTKLLYPILLTLILLPSILALIAFNPAISTQDTYDTMVLNTQNIYGMSDWHPFFYCLCLKILLSVWDNPVFIVLFQYLMWGYVFIRLFSYLRDRGMSDRSLLIIAAIIGLSPCNFLQLNTIWKDVPYTIALVMLTVVLARLLTDRNNSCRSILIHIELITSLIIISQMRKNGLVVAVITVLFVAFLFRKIIITWISVTVLIAVTLFINYPLKAHFNVQKTGMHGAYIGLSQDILGVYYSGGYISHEVSKMADVMTDHNPGGYRYNISYAQQSYELDVGMTEFIRGYIDTFVHNPVMLTKAVIAREDAVWDIFAGRNTYIGWTAYYGTADGIDDWTGYYEPRSSNALTTVMSFVADRTSDIEILSVFFWRCGIITLLLLVSLSLEYIRNGRTVRMLVVLPVLGQLISLLLSTGWSDFRYFWSIYIMNFIIILILSLGKNTKEQSTNETIGI